jgi:hypothetical protein
MASRATNSSVDPVILERGGLPGHELGDWLQAERELERAALSNAQGSSTRGAVE